METKTEQDLVIMDSVSSYCCSHCDKKLTTNVVFKWPATVLCHSCNEKFFKRLTKSAKSRKKKL